MALQNGVDVKNVSSMLGHYDAGFTLRTYTHAMRQMQRNTAEKMGIFMAQVRQKTSYNLEHRRESSFLSDALYTRSVHFGKWVRVWGKICPTP